MMCSICCSVALSDMFTIMVGRSFPYFAQKRKGRDFVRGLSAILKLSLGF